MCRLTRAFCCCPLRIGSLLVAFLAIAWHLYRLVHDTVTIKRYDEASSLLIFSLVLDVLGIGINVLLLIGTVNYYRTAVLLSAVFKAFLLAFTTGVYIAKIAAAVIEYQESHTQPDYPDLIVTLFFYVLAVYLIMIVGSFYREMKGRQT